MIFDEIEKCPEHIPPEYHAALLFLFNDYPRNRSLNSIMSHLDFLQTSVTSRVNWKYTNRKYEVQRMARIFEAYRIAVWNSVMDKNKEAK